jgi:pilus assembly protein CpaB
MKEKKIIILYILMLIVGLALLFTKSSPPPVAEPVVQPQVEVKEEPKQEEPKTEIITIAVAKHDISKKTILTKDDYYFKSIEIKIDSEQKSEYITNATELDSYVVKSNIAKDSFIERHLIASPNSSDYAMLALKEGNYMFPFRLEQIDSYLVKNLKGGDLVDLYIFYSDAEPANFNNKVLKDDKLVSPSDDFVKNRIKPIIVGKKILYIDIDDVGIDSKFQKKDTGQIQLELSNQEIKLLRTLMTNSTIIMYPSNYKKSVDDGLRLLSDKEKNWPLTDKAIFSKKKQINLLKGN